MFLTDPVERAASQVTSGTAVTSFSATTTAAILPGAVLKVIVTTTLEAGMPASGATNHHTDLQDTVGNVYVKLGEVSRIGTQGSPTVSLWLLKVVTEIPSGSTITATTDISVHARILVATEYQLEDPLATIALDTLAIAHGESTAMSVTCTPPAEEEFTWLLAYGAPIDVIAGLTLDALYTSDRAKYGTSGGGFYRSCVMAGQYRQLQAPTQTWAGVQTNQPWGLLLAAITVTPPPPPAAIPGTREIQAEFETPTAGLDETTTDRRPDAVSWDYRTASTKGPKALGDTSDGIVAHTWRLRSEPGALWIARETPAGTAFGAEELLTTYSGVDVDELDFAFTEDANVVVIAERATGSGGAPQIHLYWYDPLFSIYEWRIPWDGRTPRCVSDYFPTTVGPHICPPQVDVQLFYLKPLVGLVRREESDRFVADAPTVLANSSTVYLQKAVRTTDRRISVEYGKRNIATGRWQLKRVDSKPYRDSLLARPTFLNWSSPFLDLMRSSKEGFAGTSITTSDWNLRVVVADDVDAIEVAASAEYPSGANPPFVEQEQESAIGFTVGGYQDFTFSIASGLDTFSLVAFRARTRRTISGITCYSPWRYTIIPASAPQRPSPVDLDVNCTRDLLVDLPDRNAFVRHGLVEGIRETSAAAGPDPRPFVCSDLPAYTEADTVTGPYAGWWFVGGSQNRTPSYPFPTHYRRYTVRRRALELVDFSDEDGSYAGAIYGDVMEGQSGSDTTKPYDWPGNRFPAQFPDDGGAWPAIPTTFDIIAES